MPHSAAGFAATSRPKRDNLVTVQLVVAGGAPLISVDAHLARSLLRAKSRIVETLKLPGAVWVLRVAAQLSSDTGLSGVSVK